jgi:hypothetical protein
MRDEYERGSARLESALHDLGRSLDTGPVPDVVPDVLPRLAAPAARSRRRYWVRGGLAAAAAGLLVGVVPGAAAALGDFFGSLPGVVFGRDAGTPPTVAPVPEPAAGPLGASIDLTGPVTLAEARGAVDFPVVVPATLAAPAEVYLHGTQAVTMVWPAAPGLPAVGPSGVGLVVDVLDPRQGWLYLKRLGEAPERFLLDGREAAWVGEPHPLVLLDEQGGAAEGRPATRTLVVSGERYTVRIESLLDREQAVAVARSLAA